MNYRECFIFNGVRFSVPAHIQRIDKLHKEANKTIHGWQLRYGKWTFFSDRSLDGSGAESSLAEATRELIRRIHTIDAPTGLRRHVGSGKSTGLPPGISGPIFRIRKDRRVPELNFGVSIPRFGMKPTNATVYIGTENSVDDERYQIALARAIEIRKKAEVAYQQAANQARRAKAPPLDVGEGR